MNRTTVRLPEDLLLRAKQKALEQGRTLTSLIEEGLTRILSESGLQYKHRKVDLPVSTATGGLLPGVDLTNASELLDAMESE